MAALKRTKATKQQKRYTKKAGVGAYSKMLAAATEVVLRNRGRQYRDGGAEYVLMEFPHWCVFTESFPPQPLDSRTPLTNTYRINAMKLLNWLYENGHSPYTSEMLVRQTKQFEFFTNEIDRMLGVKKETN